LISAGLQRRHKGVARFNILKYFIFQVKHSEILGLKTQKQANDFVAHIQVVNQLLNKIFGNALDQLKMEWVLN
jgi:hypothetical protein